MANEGTLITAGVTLVAAVAFWMAARAAHGGAQRGAIRLFYLVIGAFLVLSGSRQLFAYAGDEVMDQALFLVLVVPAAFAVVPLVHLTSMVLWGDPARSRWIDAGFTAAVLLGLVAFYAEGIDGPVVSYWGTDWTIHSLVAQVVLVFVVALPALASGITIVAVARRLEGGDRRRLRAVGWSIVVYYVVFTTDAFALSGGVLVAERLVTAGAALWAWAAYQGDA